MDRMPPSPDVWGGILMHARAARIVALILLGSLSLAAAPVQGQLLSKAAREQIDARIAQVQTQIEALEDEMYALAEKSDSLVTSRERWYAEMDRVQSELRSAERDLLQSSVRLKEMQQRLEGLKAQSASQLTNDVQLKTLRERQQEHEKRKERIEKDPTIRDRSKAPMLDSIQGEIFDLRMEIAQREESLQLGYAGGQAVDFERRIRDLESDMAVKREMKRFHEERLAQLKALSPQVTRYFRLARQVEGLQILYRRLFELRAQQHVEELRSLGTQEPKELAARSENP